MKKKTKTWLEKFQDFWGKLKSEEQGNLYTILTALRGPDVKYKIKGKKRCDNVKLATTARIRREVFKCVGETTDVFCYLGFTREKGEGDIDRKRAKEVAGRFSKPKIFGGGNRDHFFDHAEHAYNALQKVNPGCLDDIAEIFE